MEQVLRNGYSKLVRAICARWHVEILIDVAMEILMRICHRASRMELCCKKICEHFFGNLRVAPGAAGASHPKAADASPSADLSTQTSAQPRFPKEEETSMRYREQSSTAQTQSSTNNSKTSEHKSKTIEQQKQDRGQQEQQLKRTAQKQLGTTQKNIEHKSKATEHNSETVEQQRQHKQQQQQQQQVLLLLP